MEAVRDLLDTPIHLSTVLQTLMTGVNFFKVPSVALLLSPLEKSKRKDGEAGFPIAQVRHELRLWSQW